MRSPTALLDGAIQVFRSNIQLFFYIYLIPAFLVVVFSVSAGSFEKNPDAQAFFSVILPMFAVLVAANLLMGIAMIRAVSAVHETTFKSAYQFAFKNFWSYALVSAIVSAAMSLGVLFFIPAIIFREAFFAFLGIVPAIIYAVVLGVWFCFSYFALLLEGKRGIEALKASKGYVQGKWWAVCLRLAFIVLITVLLSIAVEFFLEALPLTINEWIPLLITQAINFVVVPVSISYVYLLYLDLKNPEPVQTEI